MLRRNSKTIDIFAAAFAVVVGIRCLIGSASENGPVKAAPGAEEKQFEAWWDNLEDEESVASRALLSLSARPKEAVAFLKARMKPLKIDNDAVFAMLDRLASDDDSVWKPAFEE